MSEDRTAKMMHWITENPKKYYDILDGNENLSYQKCLELITELEENELYELIIILMEQNEKNQKLSDIKDAFMLSLAAKQWADMGTKKAVQLLKEIIATYIKDDKEADLQHESDEVSIEDPERS